MKKQLSPNLITVVSFIGILVSVFYFFKSIYSEHVGIPGGIPFLFLFGTIFSISMIRSKSIHIHHKTSKKKFKFAPINSAFMASSILGILIGLMYVYPINSDWGVAFVIVFGIMFIAAIVSMTLASPDEFVDLETK